MGALVKKLDEIGVEWADPQEHGVGRALFNRILHLLARNLPGSMSLRVSLHKARGVKFHGSAFISSDVYIDDGHPEYLEIGNEVSIGVRAVIITHMREHVSRTVIEDEVFVGANATLLPGVRIGRGSVVAAGSTVVDDVPPYTFVAGVPARPIRKVTKPLGLRTAYKDFIAGLRPLGISSNDHSSEVDSGSAAENGFERPRELDPPTIE